MTRQFSNKPSALLVLRRDADSDRLIGYLGTIAVRNGKLGQNHLTGYGEILPLGLTNFPLKSDYSFE